VPAQALFLLNHPFVREQALHFARRLLNGTGPADTDRVRAAYRLALGREPRPEEMSDAAGFLAQYAALAATRGRAVPDARTAAWQSFCQALFCRNEFLYVD
jgi:hypothetical protein